MPINEVTIAITHDIEQMPHIIPEDLAIIPAY